MQIGCVREIKIHEYRVGLTPDGVSELVCRGHIVRIEAGAGSGAGHTDAEYETAGAEICPNSEEIWDWADLVIKVKEPQESEYRFFRDGLIVFTYFHLAADIGLANKLLETGVTAVAYETIELSDRSLPCLTPMSEIAGRLSIQEGAKYLEKEYGGRGILLSGIPGVLRGTISILGGGVVGTNACKIAIGIGANVNILDINQKRLAYLDDIFGSAVTTLYATEANIARACKDADLLVGAVLLPAKRTPRLITRSHIATMKPGAVFVDVSIDQGGCSETSRPTTHRDPIYIVDDVIHYCVTNMPSAVAYSATQALTSVTLPYLVRIADRGLKTAAQENSAVARGINTYGGACVHPAVAESCGLEFHREFF